MTENIFSEIDSETCFLQVKNSRMLEGKKIKFGRIDTLIQNGYNLIVLFTNKHM